MSLVNIESTFTQILKGAKNMNIKTIYQEVTPYMETITPKKLYDVKDVEDLEQTEMDKYNKETQDLIKSSQDLINEMDEKYTVQPELTNGEISEILDKLKLQVNQDNILAVIKAIGLMVTIGVPITVTSIGITLGIIMNKKNKNKK